MTTNFFEMGKSLHSTAVYLYGDSNSRHMATQSAAYYWFLREFYERQVYALSIVDILYLNL